MSNFIKRFKKKESDGTMSSYIPFGMDAKYIFLKDGKTLADIYDANGNLTIDGSFTASEYKNPVKIVTFADGTDDEIAAMLNAHYTGEINISDYWSVGDTRTISLNSIASPNEDNYTDDWSAQDITIVIAAFDQYDLATTNGTRSKCALVCQTREVMNNLIEGYGDEEGTIYVNLNSDDDTDYENHHWSTIAMRIWMNGDFLNNVFSSSTFKNLIKPVKRQVLATRGCSGTNSNGTVDTTTEIITDSIFLPTYQEIFGNVKFGSYMSGTTPSGEEGTQWNYYTTSSNRIKYGNNNGSPNSTAYEWWTGSPLTYYDSSNDYYWCSVYSDEANYMPGFCAFGFAPAFAL